MCTSTLLAYTTELSVALLRASLASFGMLSVIWQRANAGQDQKAFRWCLGGGISAFERIDMKRELL